MHLNKGTLRKKHFRTQFYFKPSGINNMEAVTPTAPAAEEAIFIFF